MTEPTDKPPRRVGRGYPPEEHRWKLGQSGNPRGRTPGARNKVKAALGSAAMTSGDMAAIKEAYRTVTSSEGESLSTIEAVHRARNIAAMKGNRLAAKNADERLARAEEKAQREKDEAFRQALEYQSMAVHYAQIAAERGLPAPDFYPHPEDIALNFGTLSVEIEGPLTALEAREWSQLIAEINWARQRVLFWRRRVEQDFNSASTQYLLIKFTDAFLTCNEMLPERYRVKRLPAWPAGKTLPFPDEWVEKWAAATGKRKLRRVTEV